MNTLDFKKSVTAAKNPEINYYEILNVPSNADTMLIRESFFRMKTLYNGDTHALYSLMSEEESRVQLALIEEAYSTLSDESKRRIYDRRLAQAHQSVHTDVVNISPAPAAAVPTVMPSEALDLSSRQGATPSLEQPQFVKQTRAVLHAQKVFEEATQVKYREIIAESDLSDGDLVRKLREQVGVNINEMQERTKISFEYIRAIEQNRFERLPTVVYVKGFLRNIFKYLNVPDSERIVDAFTNRLHEWQQQPRN